MRLAVLGVVRSTEYIDDPPASWTETSVLPERHASHLGHTSMPCQCPYSYLVQSSVNFLDSRQLRSEISTLQRPVCIIDTSRVTVSPTRDIGASRPVLQSCGCHMKCKMGHRLMHCSFCEEDYAFTPYVAEFINTISNLAYCYCAYLYTKDGSWDLQAAALTLVGIGSFAFHATLMHEAQYADDLSMLILAASFQIPVSIRRHYCRAYAVTAELFCINAKLLCNILSGSHRDDACRDATRGTY